MSPVCRISNTASPISPATEQRRGELELSQSCVSLGKEANVFVLNVPSCKYFGCPSAPFWAGMDLTGWG